MRVRSVSESRTVATWTLIDPHKKSSLIVVGGDRRDHDDARELVHLTLYISFELNGHGFRQYALDFDSAQVNERVARYNMRWRDLSPNAQPTQYCLAVARDPQQTDLPPPASDQVVFQGAIQVDPDRGRVVRDQNNPPTYVTMSCFLGAPATVYGWGYGYRAPDDPFYFAAGIHMKRASYCGDEHHYTVAGTSIELADDKGLNLEEHRTGSPRLLEAWWTPTGASCVNPENFRRPDQVRKQAWDRTCGGKLLESCKAPKRTGPRLHYLGDGPLHQAR